MFAEYETDVLVIGGGAAGLRAALAAKDKGVEVLITYKQGGNSTIMAAGAFSVVLESETNPDSTKQHYEDTIKGGGGLNSPELVGRLVEEGPQEITKLREWGMEFIEEEPGVIKLFQTGGHFFPRSLRSRDKKKDSLHGVLFSQVKKRDIKIINDLFIVELIKDEEEVIGALGVSAKGQIIFIKAKAVVLATGGLGQLYSNTTNPPGINGDGYLLGLKAGASLTHMEFIQFMPTTLAYPKELKGRTVSETLRGQGAILLNKDEERFMLRYSPEKGELATRDKVAQAVFSEIIAGRGTVNDGVYLDATKLTKLDIESYSFYQSLVVRGIDPLKETIEIAPAAHFCCGGIKIDSSCFTGVSGLWAAGEVAGGIHGSNRLGGNALTEILVFGKIAGEEAGLRAKAYSFNKSFSKEKIPGLMEKVETLGQLLEEESKKVQHQELIKIKSDIQATMWQCCGIIRNKDTMEKGIRELKNIANKVTKLKEKGSFGVQTITLVTIENMLTLGEVILEAALKRKESTGCHFVI